jgi:uncharacterized Zn finger protein
MTQKGAPRFDVDMLRDRAGDKAFARGEDYFRSEQVQILIIEAGRVLAQVAGSEDYRTELRGRGRSIDGHCSCPAFADFGFCKHMVALGLAANAAGGGAGAGAEALSRIRDHLKSKSVDFLADVIVDVAERDPKLFRKLELAATIAQLDDATLETRLRKAIDRATVAGDYIDYSSVRDWAEGVEETLEAIEQLLSDERSGVALKLAGRAIDRIERALQSIDDSDGHGGQLLAYAEEIRLAAATEARPEPVQFARDLFARDMKYDCGLADGSISAYEEVLGERGLAEYRRLAEAAWQKSSARSRKSEEFSSDLDRLAHIMDFFAEREGDVEARIALRAKNLSSSYRYLELAQFCLEHHRKQEALRYAEEGLWMFEDGRQDERLVFFTADLLEKGNRLPDAEAHLWRVFEKAPSFQLYARLRKIGGEGARRRALQSLEQRCTRQSGGWNSPADLIVEIHLSEKAFDEAWASLRRFGGSFHLKDKLAKATEKTHPAEVIEVYEADVERLATSGGYAEAVRLIARMSRLRDKIEQAAYLAALKERHGRKRNFMKLLE